MLVGACGSGAAASRDAGADSPRPSPSTAAPIHGARIHGSRPWPDHDVRRHPQGDRQPVLRRRLKPASRRPPRSGRHRHPGRPVAADATHRSRSSQTSATQGMDAIIISAERARPWPRPSRTPWPPASRSSAIDSSPAVGAYDVFVNQVDTSGIGKGLADMACDARPGLHRRDRRPLGGRPSATNQNAWIDRMKTTLEGPQVRGPRPSRRRLRRRRPTSQHPAGTGPAPKHIRTSRSSSPRRPSASWRPPRSSVAGRQVRQVFVTGLGIPDGHGRLRQGRRLPGVRASGTSPTSATWPTLSRPSWSRARSPAPRAKASPCPASTTTSRTRSAPTASSSSGRPSVRRHNSTSS